MAVAFRSPKGDVVKTLAQNRTYAVREHERAVCVSKNASLWPAQSVNPLLPMNRPSQPRNLGYEPFLRE